MIRQNLERRGVENDSDAALMVQAIPTLMHGATKHQSEISFGKLQAGRLRELHHIEASLTTVHRPTRDRRAIRLAFVQLGRSAGAGNSAARLHREVIQVTGRIVSNCYERFF